METVLFVGAIVLLLIVCWCGPAWAHDLGSELSVGRITLGEGAAHSYVSERLDVAADVNDALKVSAAAMLTHFERGALAPPHQAFVFGVGGTSGDFALDSELYLSPPSTYVYADAADSGRPSTLQERVCAYGLSIGLSVDELGGNAAGPSLGLTLGVLYNSGSRAQRLDPASPFSAVESFSLVQWRAVMELSQVVFEHTTLGASAALYAYDNHAFLFAPYASGVAQSDSMVSGFVLASPRYALRAEVTQDLGVLQLDGYLQYARDGAGDSSRMLGAKLQASVVESVSVWLGGNLQHAALDRSLPLQVLSASLGTRLVF